MNLAVIWLVNISMEPQTNAPHTLVRFISGFLLGTCLAALLIAASSKFALRLSLSTLVNDDSGVLVSKSIFAGLSFPAIYLLTCSIIIIALPVFGIVVQAKNQFPTLAKKLSVAIMLPLTLLTVWWAGNSMFRYLGELLWSYHD